MNNIAPIRESAERGWTPSWVNWFQQVFECLRWNKAFNVTATLDFPSVAANSQATLPVTMRGVRVGDAVMVTPTADIAGIVLAAVVTANDQVTVYAKNISTGAVNPLPQIFRIVVLQN